MSCFKHMQQMWPWDELLRNLPSPSPSGSSKQTAWAPPCSRGRGVRGCLCHSACPGRTPASPAHLRTHCSCHKTGHPKPAQRWLSASHLAVLLDGGFPENAEEGKNTGKIEREGRMGVLGLLGVCLWVLLLEGETNVHWCVRIKHQALLQKSQEGSGTAGSVACQLADDRCKKLTWLLIPTPLASQPHPFPKPPQRI